MSGATASRALHDRFDAIRRAELERLKKKLGGLTEADRQFVHQITTDVVDALARGPERALAQDPPSIAVEALVRLFALEV
jgi:glutamyl-tRNA reductase